MLFIMEIVDIPAEMILSLKVTTIWSPTKTGGRKYDSCISHILYIAQKMKRTNALETIFSNKYAQIVRKHVERLKILVNQYDVIIFMARKSICFYNALILQNELGRNARCCIISSRALEYDVLKKFVGKRVALIDDVVVKGTSITKAMNHLKELGIVPDIFIAACGTDFIQNESFEYKTLLQKPYVILSEIDICELATYITQYIAVSGCPYNIDQPIYKVSFQGSDEVAEFFEKNNYIDTTSSLQEKFNIVSRVIHFKSSILEQIFPKDISLDHVFLKVRLIHKKDSNEILFLPFVLLPEISYAQLEQLYQLVRSPLLDNIVHSENKRTEYENKLNIFQYIFSNIYLLKYLQELTDKHSYRKISSNEIAQFSQCICEESTLRNKARAFFENTGMMNFQSSAYIDSFLFNEYVSKVYDLVLSKETAETYINSKGTEITRNIISIKRLEAYIRKCGIEYDRYAVSNLVDIFIDRGIFVPSVVHTEDERIMRIYKGGEVAQISEKEMTLFSYMLGVYVDNGERDYLDKTEYEKLCVLFFRSAASKIFPNVPENKLVAAEGDRYEISYAKFGPRVSMVQGERYEAGQKTLLVDEMIELELLGLTKRNNDRGEKTNKYCINDRRKSFEDSTWSEFAAIVAYDFCMLRTCFIKCSQKEVDTNRTLFHYIPTYNKFLTLLAIGNNEKERLLSLAAEIYLFLNVRTGGLSLKSSLVKMKNVYDGICSGVWKYCCYRQNELLERMLRLLSKTNHNIARIGIEYVSKAVDRNPNITAYIQECGEFLQRLAYDLYRMGKRYNLKFAGVSSDFDYVISEYAGERDDGYYETASDDEVLCAIQKLRMEAGALIDKCDIFLKEEAMFSEVLKSVFVIYSDSAVFPDKLRKYALHVDLGKSRAKHNYLLIPRWDEISLCEQLEEIIHVCPEAGNMKIILCNMKEDYEGILYSKNISKGRNFDIFIDEILNYEEKKELNGYFQFVAYFPKGEEFPEIQSETYCFHEMKEAELNNSYIMKRFCGTHSRPMKPEGTHIYVERGGNMQIGSVNNSKIVENNGIYNESNVFNKNEFNPKLSENLALLLQELETLKHELDEEKAEVVEQTAAAVKQEDQSKIKEGLKHIASFGKDVLASAASTIITTYMTVYGILPPV